MAKALNAKTQNKEVIVRQLLDGDTGNGNHKDTLNAQKCQKVCLRMGLRTIFGHFSDNFRTFFGHFFDILS